jgi:hypothetical protein
VIGHEYVILTTTELVEYFNRPRTCTIIVFALQWFLVVDRFHSYPCKADTADIADLLLQTTMRIGIPLLLILIHATVLVLSTLRGREFPRVRAGYPILASSSIPTKSSGTSDRRVEGEIMA